MNLSFGQIRTSQNPRGNMGSDHYIILAVSYAMIVKYKEYYA